MSTFCVWYQTTSQPTLHTICWLSSSSTTTWSPSVCWSRWRWWSLHRRSSSIGCEDSHVRKCILIYAIHKLSFSLNCFIFLQDVEMYYSETDTPAMARTSNLNEELGQVGSSPLLLAKETENNLFNIINSWHFFLSFFSGEVPVFWQNRNSDV